VKHRLNSEQILRFVGKEFLLSLNFKVPSNCDLVEPRFRRDS
jgi:hypothetical protein